GQRRAGAGGLGYADAALSRIAGRDAVTAEIEQREPDQLPGLLPPECQPAAIGHQRTRDQLGALLEGGRLPGGILMHGPQGIGKATLAFEVAREIFARTGG